MYVPSAFRLESLPVLHDAIRAARLCNFVTATAQGLVATPLPFFLDPTEGPYGTLYGHLARANPQWSLPYEDEALALFMGPDAYVSPSWYPGKRVDGKVVPTWNYVTVQAYGRPEFFDDKDRLRQVVSRLTDQHEGEFATPWAVADAPEDFVNALLAAIIGVRMPILRIEGKSKMSQNRSETDRRSVSAGLAASRREGDQAAAKLIAPEETA